MSGRAGGEQNFRDGVRSHAFVRLIYRGSDAIGFEGGATTHHLCPALRHAGQSAIVSGAIGEDQRRFDQLPHITERGEIRGRQRIGWRDGHMWNAHIERGQRQQRVV
ncbi:MAG TPA: hypothetical protein VMR62_38530, partial [Bryobacteraceae bacterium]|nr:hypothetical protein [Bryobacteraceae bacterium]